MLTFGYLGEQSIVNPWVGFALGMADLFFILFEISVLNSAKNDAGIMLHQLSLPCGSL